MMRQLLQSLSDGRTMILEVPIPAMARGALLIRSACSLISAGTERMLVEFGRAGWLDKARQQPDRVRQALAKARTDGLVPTLQAIHSRLEQPLPLGYCNVGRVLEADRSASGFSPGDRVLSNGPHAEVVAVPHTLCARIPANVSDEEASFGVPGAIALQGLRLAAPTLGETFVVTGLGLLGLLTVQLLRANGCRVLGIDPDAQRAALAERFGAEVIAVAPDEDLVTTPTTREGGVDGVIITAATSSNAPVRQAARMCRKRGRIVLVGVAGLELERADFYEKELTLQVSCSYGPGRYDPEYEVKGRDYPLGFVRWTAQRNFAAILELLATHKLDVAPLISHRFAFEQAAAAYELLTSRREPHLGILLEYAAVPDMNSEMPAITATTRRQSESRGGREGAGVDASPASSAPAGATASPRLGFVGAGNYAARVLIPAFAATGARLEGIASASGLTAVHCLRKFGFGRATTDTRQLFEAPDVDAVVIATRHDSHAGLVLQALKAGKHVFVEKPLALTSAQIDEIAACWAQRRQAHPGLQLMVGFNRRFAPHSARIRSLLQNERGPKSFVVTVNAGAIPPTHWTQDREIGGGRILGEACHFIDLVRFLAGCPITDARIVALGAAGTSVADTAAITLAFADGSIGSINYFANGHRSFAKERLEVFCGGRILQLDNFRRLRGYGWRGFRALNLWRQDKGQRGCAQAFIAAVSGRAGAAIPVEEIFEVARCTVRLAEAARV
jgi:predicted dehydrogenase/threonine dehydrogenase-like Zn-dependent dehydrogenase